jgi:alcohol dehydrogenase class IV
MAASLFRIPPIIHYGPGAFEQLGPTAHELGLRHVLLVTDPGMVALGIAAQGQRILEQACVRVTLFDGVQPDPTLANVEAGSALLPPGDNTGIVAIGGGSPMDCAKAIAVRRGNGALRPDWIGMEKVPRGGPPVIAVPTTAGTGSEVTRAMVITDSERGVKMMFASRFCVCAAAIVDPVLTLGMPKALTAAVGVDALTHAIEAYVSRKAQPVTDLLALSAIRLIAQHLRTAYEQGDKLEARSAVMLGAMQAGMAFSNASVALVHGMARPLGACFHLTHGISIAVLLPGVTEFSISAVPERYARIAAEMGETDLVAALRKLNRDVGIPTLSGLNIGAERFQSLLEKMAADALASGSPANNPRLANAQDIIELYSNIYQNASWN